MPCPRRRRRRRGGRAAAPPAATRRSGCRRRASSAARARRRRRWRPSKLQLLLRGRSAQWHDSSRPRRARRRAHRAAPRARARLPPRPPRRRPRSTLLLAPPPVLARSAARKPLRVGEHALLQRADLVVARFERGGEPCAPPPPAPRAGGRGLGGDELGDAPADRRLERRRAAASAVSSSKRRCSRRSQSLAAVSLGRRAGASGDRRLALGQALDELGAVEEQVDERLRRGERWSGRSAGGAVRGRRPPTACRPGRCAPTGRA